MLHDLARREPWLRASAMVTAAFLLGACNDGFTPIVTADDLPDAGCARDVTPRTYQVYFVIDVSGSMGPFLTDLSEELESFALGFPEVDGEDRRVLVDYYVVAYVNDVKWFPEAAPRMTSPIAVQAAFAEAIRAGQTNQNLNQRVLNAETEENLLDALAEVIARRPAADANLVMIATDAPFVEAPATLSTNITVQSSYGTVRADLASLGVRVHAFTTGGIDGLTRSFQSEPALTTLPGSSTHDLRDLTGTEDEIRETLFNIAQDTVCN